MKTVSVIIPTYKNRGGLIESVESALIQDYPYLIQVIVVDDNDPMSEFRYSTRTLMNRYENNSKVLYLQHESNKNGAAARNTGIKAAQGDYIAFLDDDDLFLEGKISKQVSYLETHPEYDAVYCHARRSKHPAPKYVIEGDGTRQILELKSNFYTPTLMFRREALLTINGFDESFRRHQDYEILLRFFKSGYRIGCVPEVLTEIGLNQGENSPKGEKLDQLKKYFFDKFETYIYDEDIKTPGFANNVYAKHYAGVFLQHLKNKKLRSAAKVLIMYMPKSPKSFFGVLINHIVLHLKAVNSK